MIGLNLRMTETTAAIACAQLARAEKIIAGRIALAHELTDMILTNKPWIKPHIEDIGCKNVFYVWAARITNGKRDLFVNALQSCGFPIRKGYSLPLNKIFNPSQSCPITEKMENEELITYEVCAYNPNKLHLKKMREIIKWAAGEIE